MAGNTPRGYPFPGPNNLADGSTNIQGLATAVDSDVTTVLGSGIYNVITYGAVGNGVTDDTTAIQACLNAAGTYASSHGGAIVVFPPNKYAIGAGSTLQVKAGTVIRAYGATILKLGTPTTGLLTNISSADTTTAAYAGAGQIRVYGGIWDGKGQNAAASTKYKIMLFSHCNDVLVSGATIRNAASGAGICMGAVNGGTVEACRFEGYKNTGSAATFEALGIYCAVAADGIFGSNDNTHSINIKMVGCYAGPAIDGSGLASPGRLAGSQNTAASNNYFGINIYANTADTMIDTAIVGFNWNYSVIAENTIKSPAAGGILLTVPVSPPTGRTLGVNIDSNVISSPTTFGISLVGQDGTNSFINNCNITGNEISNATTFGINAQICYNIIIAENIVDTPTSSGINLQAVVRCNIHSNTIYTAGNFGIRLGQVTSPSTINSTDNLVAGNYIFQTTNGGIRLDTGSTLNLLIANTIRKGAGSAVAIASVTGAGPVNTVTQCDLTGFGDNTTTVTVTSGTLNKTIAATTNIGTNLP